MKFDLQISDKTHLALARAKDAAGPHESGNFEPDARVFMDSLAADVCKAMIERAVTPLAWVAFVQELARRFG